MTAPLSSLRLDCYVRASSLSASVDEALETLREYDQRGVIDDLTVTAWPGEVRLTADTEEPPPIAQYRRFQTWAEQTEVSLQPAFQFREQGSLVDDHTKPALVFPVLCVAIHVNGALATVAPHQSSTTTYTVADALADLAALDRDIPSRPPPSDAVTESTAPSSPASGLPDQ